jgi:predicted SAM-dependent methyltransferase
MQCQLEVWNRFVRKLVSIHLKDKDSCRYFQDNFQYQLEVWNRFVRKLVSIHLNDKGLCQSFQEDFRHVAMDEHLYFIHLSRLALVQQYIPPGRIILDLGGANSPLYRMGYPYFFKKMTLIDLPKEERCDHYKDVVVDEKCSMGKVFVRYTDMCTLKGFEKNTFDLVWSGQSIEHVSLENAKNMCQEVYRVLKKGGFFCIDTPNRLLTQIHTADCGGGLIHPEHKIEYYPEQLSSMLREVGFSIRHSCGVCEMPKTVSTNIFHYEDFILGAQITDNVNNGYIQFYQCQK